LRGDAYEASFEPRFDSRCRGVYPDEPARVPDAPPLLVAEVLSLDDRLTAVREKLEEYKAWGVAHVWLVDPHTKRLYMCDQVWWKLLHSKYRSSA